ncbi:Os03g0638800, partial [Oryza sativa Japonica Group]
QVLDGKPYNRKCDVYSFGICLWEIYCCDMPYPDLSFADVSSAVVHQVCLESGYTPIVSLSFFTQMINPTSMDRTCAQTFLDAVQVHSQISCGNAGMQILISVLIWMRWCSF